jgi:hypothetical protein
MTIINIQTNKALQDIEKINNLDKFTTASITNTMKDSYKKSYNIFWDNAIDICREAGNQAYLLFQKHVEMGQAIKERDENFVELTIPEGWTVDVKQDGSVIPTYTEPVILPIEEPIV